MVSVRARPHPTRQAAVRARPPAPASSFYVYGIVRAARPLRFEVTGMAEGPAVGTIVHQGLAAVVSEVPAGPIEPTRANLLAHERVNAAVLRAHTVLPMSFGSVFRSREDVVALLHSGHETFCAVLEQVHDRIEFGLKVFEDPDRALRLVCQQDAPLHRLGLAIARQGADLPTRMEYGRQVEAALARRSAQLVATLLARLRDVSVASRCHPALGERMVMDAAFLVQRRQEAAFDARLQAIANDFGDLSFQYSGPWPPYNFVTIRFKPQAPG